MSTKKINTETKETIKTTAEKRQVIVATVARPFRDKDTKKEYRIGDSYEHLDPQRIKLLTEKGFLEKSSEDENGDKPDHEGGYNDGTES